MEYKRLPKMQANAELLDNMTNHISYSSAIKKHEFFGLKTNVLKCLAKRI